MEDIASQILNLVRKKMREQGAYSRESFRESVEESIDYYLAKGRLSEEDNIQFLIDNLMQYWDNVEGKLGEEK